VIRNFASAQTSCPAHHERAPKPVSYPSGYKTLLSLVLRSTNLVLLRGPNGGHISASRDEHNSSVGEEKVSPFLLSHSWAGDKPLGYVREGVLQAILKDHENRGWNSPWNIKFVDEGQAKPEVPSSIAFADWVNNDGVERRTKELKRLIDSWKDSDTFTEILRGMC